MITPPARSDAPGTPRHARKPGLPDRDLFRPIQAQATEPSVGAVVVSASVIPPQSRADTPVKRKTPPEACLRGVGHTKEIAKWSNFSLPKRDALIRLQGMVYDDV